MTRQKEQEDWAEKNKRGDRKGNQMTALRFQTGGGYQPPFGNYENNSIIETIHFEMNLFTV